MLSCSQKYDITLVSPRNYFLYTPLLPAVATGTVEERSIVEPIRRIMAGKVQHCLMTHNAPSPCHLWCQPPGAWQCLCLTASATKALVCFKAFQQDSICQAWAYAVAMLGKTQQSHSVRLKSCSNNENSAKAYLSVSASLASLAGLRLACICCVFTFCMLNRNDYYRFA